MTPQIRGLNAMLLSLSISGTALAASEFHVAESGRDANPGTKDAPFATLSRARDAVREAVKKLKESITVHIHGGTYRLAETLVFGLDDSAPEGCTVTYDAFPGETPVLESGILIGGWRKLDQTLAGLPAAAKGNIWEADLPEGLGLFRTLYDGDQCLPCASMGFSPIESAKGREEYPMVDGNSDALRRLAFPKEALRNWPNLSDVEVAIRPHYPWVMNILTLESVDEAAGSAMTTLPGTYALSRLDGLKDGGVSAWVQNVPEALDAPGKWIVNTKERKIYLWPSGDAPGARITAPCLRELVRVEGAVDVAGPEDKPVRGLVFKGLTFARADRGTWTKEDAGIQHDWEMVDKADALLRFRGAEDCTVSGCRFAHSGGSAVRLDLHCQKIRIEDNEVADMGGGGILLIGYGPGTKDVNRNNAIVGNHIHDIGKLYWHSHAIVAWQSGGNQIANNYIHHCPRKAICLSGVRPAFFSAAMKDRRECSRTIRRNEVGGAEKWKDVLPFLHTRNCMVEHNEVHHVLQMLGDGAAINISGAGEGNVIRRNYVHDIENPACTSCIRTDDAQKGTLVEENIIFRAVIGGLTPKYENHFVNNFVVAAGGVAGDAIHTTGRWGPFEKARIERNIFINTGKSKGFWGGFKAEDVPKLAACTIDRNVYFRLEAKSDDETRRHPFLEALRKNGHDAHSYYGDPLFVDWTNGGFRFRENSPASQMGIRPLNLQCVGLEGDYALRYRRSDPSGKR